MNDYKRLSSSDMRDKYTKKIKQRFNKNHGALSVLKKVFYYARDYRFYLYFALLMDVVNTVCIVFLPIYTGKCINCIIAPGNVNFSELYKNMTMMAIVAIIDVISI